MQQGPTPEALAGTYTITTFLELLIMYPIYIYIYIYIYKSLKMQVISGPRKHCSRKTPRQDRRQRTAALLAALNRRRS